MYKKKPYYAKKKKGTASPETKKRIREDRFCDNLLFNVGKDINKNRRQFQETVAYYAAHLQTHPDDLKAFNSFLLRFYPNASVIPNLGRRLKKAAIEKRKNNKRLK